MREFYTCRGAIVLKQWPLTKLQQKGQQLFIIKYVGHNNELSLYLPYYTPTYTPYSLNWILFSIKLKAIKDQMFIFIFV